MRESVIVSAVRTPTGKFLGALKGFPATDLGAMAVREAVRRAGIDPAGVDECIMGNVVSAALGQAPARQAALKGGLPEQVAALTINKVCGSGLKAVMLAAQGIATGDIDIAVAGGMESMSNAPYYLPRIREGLRMGDGQVVDAMILDGLWCAFDNCHMGITGEHVAEKYGVSRAEQDAYAARSHQKAASATREGWFKDEMLTISIPQKKGDPTVIDRDEPIREDTTAEALAKLKPAFKSGGTVTAGNSSQMTDGAAAVLLTTPEIAAELGLEPLARYVTYAVAGVPPEVMGIGPVEAVPKALGRAGLRLEQMGVIELNEAFAAQSLAVLRRLRLDGGDDRINPNGGAIALGHPLGCSGARITAELVNVMEQKDAEFGLATMCIGVGQGIATVLQRV
jgi:acetyl-CoA C-acetyltransferase